MEKIELAGGYYITLGNPTGKEPSWVIADAENSIIFVQDPMATPLQIGTFSEAMTGTVEVPDFPQTPIDSEVKASPLE